MKRRASTVFSICSALGLAASAAIYTEIPQNLIGPEGTYIKNRAIDICEGDFSGVTFVNGFFPPARISCYLTTKQQLQDAARDAKNFSALMLLLASVLGFTVSGISRLQEARLREQDNNRPEAGL